MILTPSTLLVDGSVGRIHEFWSLVWSTYAHVHESILLQLHKPPRCSRLQSKTIVSTK